VQAFDRTRQAQIMQNHDGALARFGRGARGGLMAIEWRKDADAALAEAKQQRKPVLADFSAAPM
jgi:hypothetical protein